MPPSLRQRLVGGGAWVLAGKVASSACTLAVLSLTASLLSQASYGEFMLVYSTAQVAAIAALLGASTAVVRFVGEALGHSDPARARAAVRTSFRVALWGISGLVLFLVAGGGAGGLVVQPQDGAAQGLVFPLPCVVAVAREHPGAGDRALEALPGVVLAWRFRGAAAAPLVVGEDTVDEQLGLR